MAYTLSYWFSATSHRRVRQSRIPNTDGSSRLPVPFCTELARDTRNPRRALRSGEPTHSGCRIRHLRRVLRCPVSVPRCSLAFSDQGRSRSTGRRRPPRFRPGRRLPEHSPAATLSVVGSSVAREDRSAGLPHLRGTAWVRQCEGCDLNAWTPTGADLESAAVSWLGYPRTLCRSRRALSAHQCVRAGNIKHYDFGCVLLRHRIYLMLHGRSDRSCATRNDTKSKQSKFPD